MPPHCLLPPPCPDTNIKHLNHRYLRNAVLGGMPPTYIEVVEFDCLRDEGIGFAESLKNSGIPTEIFEIKSAIHGFEIARHSEIVIESVNRRVNKLQQVFYQLQ
jgi:acetyl esterase/lipase